MMQSLVNLMLFVWNTVFRGLIVKIFWGWFVLPLFPALPTLTVVSAIGLVYMVSALYHIKGLTKEELDKSRAGKLVEEQKELATWNGVCVSVVLGLLLLCGYIVHLLM